jgi:hypothetical protein
VAVAEDSSIDRNVFLSYSHDDRAYVDQLANRLNDADVKAWFDHELDPGDLFRKKIEQAIDSCVAFVVVLTPASVASTWVQTELSRAVRKFKPLFPLLRKACDLPIYVEESLLEDVTDGRMPTPRFFARLRALCAPTTTGESPVDGTTPATLLDIERHEPWLERMRAGTARTRIGAIDALQRSISSNDREGSRDIVTALAALVRAETTRSGYQDPPEPLPDVAAAVSAITRCGNPGGLSRWVDLSGAQLRGVNLREACLAEAILRSAHVSEADLFKANLHKAKLDSGGFDAANLSYANLSEADLSRARLTKANLSHANLSEASRNGAGLTKANLTHANLRKAILAHAWLS